GGSRPSRLGAAGVEKRTSGPRSRNAGSRRSSRSSTLQRKSVQFEPPQRQHFSTTWRRLRVLMKRVGCEVRLRQGYGGQPSRGFPNLARGKGNHGGRRLGTPKFSR